MAVPKSAQSTDEVKEVAHGPAGRVLLMDSISRLHPEHRGAIVVSGSHGGASAAAFAMACPLMLVVFNDAGVGKDGAGIAGLAMLQAHGTAAATVAHTSARIGEAADTWASGVVSHVNGLAGLQGLAAGQPLREALHRLLGD